MGVDALGYRVGKGLNDLALDCGYRTRVPPMSRPLQPELPRCAGRSSIGMRERFRGSLGAVPRRLDLRARSQEWGVGEYPCSWGVSVANWCEIPSDLSRRSGSGSPYLRNRIHQRLSVGFLGGEVRGFSPPSRRHSLSYNRSYTTSPGGRA